MSDDACSGYFEPYDTKREGCRYASTLARAEKAELDARYWARQATRCGDDNRAISKLRDAAETALRESESNLVLSGSLLQASGKRVAELEARLRASQFGEALK